MEKEAKLVGKGLTPEDEAAAREFLEFKKGEAAKPLEGELEKEPWQTEWIDSINRYLAEKLEGLGIEVPANLRNEQFHFLPPEVYIKHFPGVKTDAFFKPIDNAAYFVTRPERMKLAKQMLHEAIHMIANRKWYADISKREITEYRSGYVSFNPKSSTTHEHLRGFNEAVTDRITAEILADHYDEPITDLDIRPEEESVPVSYYVDYMNVVDLVIKGIAEKNGETEDAVWTRFKRGIFTGEMMHLRDIERTYGKGALKVLGALGSGAPEFAKTTNKLVSSYFETEDPDERKKIAKQLAIRVQK